MTKPCPFCQNTHTNEYDAGGTCCFCDYEGEVTVGKYGMFSNIEQYNKIYFANSHQDRLDELHGRNDEIKNLIFETIKNELPKHLIKADKARKVYNEK